MHRKPVPDAHACMYTYQPSNLTPKLRATSRVCLRSLLVSPPGVQTSHRTASIVHRQISCAVNDPGRLSTGRSTAADPRWRRPLWTRKQDTDKTLAPSDGDDTRRPIGRVRRCRPLTSRVLVPSTSTTRATEPFDRTGCMTCQITRHWDRLSSGPVHRCGRVRKFI